PPVPVAGWSFSERGAALYDGRPVGVAASRLRLLRALVEAEEPLPAKGLIGRAFDRNTSETNVRFHVGELRRGVEKGVAGGRRGARRGVPPRAPVRGRGRVGPFAGGGRTLHREPRPPAPWNPVMPRWQVVRLIAGREIRDQLRDRRTLFLILGLPVLMYPLFVGVGLVFAAALKDKKLVVGVVGVDALPKPRPDVTPVAGAPPRPAPPSPAFPPLIAP